MKHNIMIVKIFMILVCFNYCQSKKCKPVAKYRCQFPFKFKSKTYNSCTKVENNGIDWCATTVHKTTLEARKWGNCTESCPTEDSIGKKNVFNVSNLASLLLNVNCKATRDSGKSEIGIRLKALLGQDCEDTDDEVAEKSEMCDRVQFSFDDQNSITNQNFTKQSFEKNGKPVYYSYRTTENHDFQTMIWWNKKNNTWLSQTRLHSGNKTNKTKNLPLKLYSSFYQ